ncbi:hypothetical protein HDU90_005507 [Geranomyces variabilis]|nr:hypothetical protein HDU90_005507 [Geranomyces variabilis]
MGVDGAVSSSSDSEIMKPEQEEVVHGDFAKVISCAENCRQHEIWQRSVYWGALDVRPYEKDQIASGQCGRRVVLCQAADVDDEMRTQTRQQHALYGKDVVRKARKPIAWSPPEAEAAAAASPTEPSRGGRGGGNKVYGEHGEMIVMEVMGQELQESTGRVFQVNQWWNFTAKNEAICPAVRNAITGMFINDERKVLIFTRHMSGPKRTRPFVA